MFKDNLKDYCFFILSVVVSTVIGIISIQPIKLKIDWIYSSWNVLLFKMSNTLYLHVINQIINVIKLPRKANNKVFAVVPNMSLPIFKPDFINSLELKFLLFWYTSYNAEDTAIAESVVDPIKPIKISAVVIF